MLTCNLFETIHNIWLQESGKRGVCLYVSTSDDYMRIFRQLALHYAFLHDDRLGIGPYRDQLQLCRVS
jgi:hypothetical protein